MVSKLEIQVALDVKALGLRFGQLDSACSRHDVPGMLAITSEIEARVRALRDKLQAIYDSAEYMHGGAGVENTPAS